MNVELTITGPVPKAKPCPWCGKQPEVIYEARLDLGDLKLETFRVQCDTWRCQVRPKVSKPVLADALVAWNTRKGKR